MPKTLTSVALAVAALLSYSGAAAAAEEIKFRLTLTPQDPVTQALVGDPDATGKAEFTILPDESLICYEIEAEGTTEPVEPSPGIGSAHIHFAAGGGIALNLETEFQRDKADEFKSSGCVEADDELIAAILANPEAYYLNIHTHEFAGGALFASLAG